MYHGVRVWSEVESDALCVLEELEAEPGKNSLFKCFITEQRHSIVHQSPPNNATAPPPISRPLGLLSPPPR